ncbi:MAG TPA: phosphatidylglycerophosphatase A [Blastocatellia bacterium]|nr:phosphatidylglycerophosphatase A [Blastocatellia bacterium]
MKHEIDRRSPKGLKDFLSLAITTFGVGYLPIAPGTFGSIVGVLIYLGTAFSVSGINAGLQPEIADSELPMAWIHAVILLVLLLFTLIGIWAASRSAELFGNSDPSEAVVDEVIGQLIVFLFIPFTFSWQLILAGFLLFRLFDIWKPYPIDSLQNLPSGIGICADDVLAGVYAGICLAFIYALRLSF